MADQKDSWFLLTMHFSLAHLKSWCIQLYFRSVNKLTCTVTKDFFFQDTNVLYYIKTKKLLNFNLCTVFIVVFPGKMDFWITLY